MVNPILFNTEMVRAILDGRKTVTRRVVEPQPRAVYFDGVLQTDDDENVLIAEGNNGELIQIVPHYRPDDILWVRETWTSLVGSYLYRADQKPGMKNPGKWCPSIYMPREAARIWLRVTDVRVERLRDISIIEAEKEGCENILRFDELWDSTIKPADRERYGWAANPYCWVITFERICKDEAMQ